MPQQKIIFDTDPGIDDAMALLYIARSPELQLVGVTTTHGNNGVDVTTRNALYLKQRFGLQAPVAAGAEKPLERVRRHSPTDIHGHNGLGDVPIPDNLSAQADPRPAWRFIVEETQRAPGEIVLVAVGALTNLALALKEDPQIAARVKGVVVMGGAFGVGGHSGNASPVAEANILSDPEAADAVFTAPWPVTVVGLDVTNETVMSEAFLRTLKAEGGEAGRFIWDITRVYEAFYRAQTGIEGIACHDCLAVAFVLDPTLFTLRHGPIRVVTDGLALGQTIQRHQKRRFAANAWDGHPAQAVCVGVDSARFLAGYSKAFGARSEAHA